MTNLHKHRQDILRELCFLSRVNCQQTITIEIKNAIWHYFISQNCSHGPFEVLIFYRVKKVFLTPNSILFCNVSFSQSPIANQTKNIIKTFLLHFWQIIQHVCISSRKPTLILKPSAKTCFFWSKRPVPYPALPLVDRETKNVLQEMKIITPVI